MFTSKHVSDSGLFVASEQQVCEFCERSMVARFPDAAPMQYCQACSDEWDRLNSAGKLELVLA